MLKVHDKHFVPFIAEETIQHKVKELAATIDKDYAGKKPLVIAILNGSFMFAADLFKHLTIEAEICFIKLASYKGTKSSGQVVTAIGLDIDINERHLIILEDIVDTGRTLHHFIPQLQHQQPASLHIAVLLDKPEPRQFEVPISYCCFSIPNKFVLGYGLDYDGFGRNIKEIYQLHQD